MTSQVLQNMGILAQATSPSIADWIQVVLVAITALGILYAARQAGAAATAIKYSAEQNRLAAEQNKLASEQTRLSAEQTELSRKQLEEDLRQFRHEHAVTVLKEWAQFTATLNPSLVYLATQLDGEQAKLLVQRQPIKLKPDQCEVFCDVLEITRATGQEVHLSRKHVTAIRAEAAKVLNMLEWCLSVWAEFAQEELILKQFKGISDPDSCEMPMPEFRKAVGAEKHFPSIVKFETELKRRKQEQAVNKTP